MKTPAKLSRQHPLLQNRAGTAHCCPLLLSAAVEEAAKTALPRTPPLGSLQVQQLHSNTGTHSRLNACVRSCALCQTVVQIHHRTAASPSSLACISTPKPQRLESVSIQPHEHVYKACRPSTTLSCQAAKGSAHHACVVCLLAQESPSSKLYATHTCSIFYLHIHSLPELLHTDTL